MRVLFTISCCYLPQSRKGTETNTDQLCRALQRQGHEVAVLAGLSRRTFTGIRNSVRCLLRFADCGPPDHVCGYPVFRSPYGVTNLRQSLSHVLPTFRPDVVVTQLRHAVDLADLAQSTGVPALVYIHTADFGWIGLPSSATDRVKFLSNSQYTAKRLFDQFGIRSAVVYNIFSPDTYRADLKGECVTFVNPCLVKGVELALQLAEMCPQIPFLFVGSDLDPADKVFKRKADAIANIRWMPTTDDMKSVYGQTKILIVPSRVDETWGRVVTEAQFTGIPVLASNRGGLPESVGCGGMLLSDEDVFSWQVALQGLWRDDRQWQELSQRALHHAVRHEIQPATITKRFVDEISKVLE